MGGKIAGEPAWCTGKQCDTGACVEIAALGESVLIRSSADPAGPVVKLSREEWRAFVAGLKDGDFDSV
jgi:hypothetical protein